jgi:predicted outer membrane repeat protein
MKKNVLLMFYIFLAAELFPTAGFAALTASATIQQDIILALANNNVDSVDIATDIAINPPINVSRNFLIRSTQTVFSLMGGNNSQIFNITGGKLKLENLILQQSSATAGGAINIDSGAELQTTNVNFENNKAIGEGGAIYNNGTAKISSASFSTNKAADGGAIYNNGTMNITSSTFVYSSATASGGAIYNSASLTLNGNNNFSNNEATDGGAIYLNSGTLAINGRANFTQNSATGDGGAIFVGSGATLDLNGDISFSGNMAAGSLNSIFINGGTVNINSGNIDFNDPIAGTGDLNVVGGQINFTNSPNFSGNMSLSGGTLGLIQNNNYNIANFNMSGGTLSLLNKNINTANISSFSGTGGTIKFDADLSNNTADTLNLNGASATFNVTEVFVIKDISNGAASSTVSLDGINLNLTLNIDGSKVWYGPVYAYGASASGNQITFTPSGDFNPIILVQSFANNGAVLNNLLTVNTLLNRIQLMTDGDLAKYKTWFLPYVAMQNFDLKTSNAAGNDIKDIENTAYGATMGIDMPALGSADSFIFIPSVFAGYTGGKQEYQKVSATRDSFIVGLQGVLAHNYFLLSAESHITNGSISTGFETQNGGFDMFTFTAGAKAQSDIPLGVLHLQPAFAAAYNLINSQNYETSLGADIKSSKMTNLKVIPQIKLSTYIGNWRPYLNFAYNYSAFSNDYEMSANGIALPAYELKDYFEYAAGLENSFTQIYSFFINFSGYSGNARGVALQAGFRGYL